MLTPPVRWYVVASSAVRKPKALVRSVSSHYSGFGENHQLRRVQSTTSRPVPPRRAPLDRIEHDFSPSLGGADGASSAANDSRINETNAEEEDRYVTYEQLMQTKSCDVMAVNDSASVNDCDDVYENAQNISEGGVMKARPAAAPRRNIPANDTMSQQTVLAQSADAPTADDNVGDQDEYENSLGSFGVGMSVAKVDPEKSVAATAAIPQKTRKISPAPRSRPRKSTPVSHSPPQHAGTAAPEDEYAKIDKSRRIGRQHNAPVSITVASGEDAITSSEDDMGMTTPSSIHSNSGRNKK